MKILILFSLIFILYARPVNAYSAGEAKNDLARATRMAQEKYDAAKRARVLAERIQTVKTYLIQNESPLANSADAFVRCADTYNLSPALIVGITRAESTFGLYYQLPNNPWNWNVHGGTGFKTLEEGACTVARGLKTNYDLTSTYTIGRRFAPSSDGNNPAHWARVVQEVINELKV